MVQRLEAIVDANYDSLKEAIILQAVDDYKKALVYNTRKTIDECEEFFRSEYFKILTTIDSETIIRHIREQLGKTYSPGEY